ncbi:MAG: glycerol-3-phosphate acyltransferase [Actinomycetes bacterium]
MSPALLVAIACIPAYLIGTFPTAVLVSRARGRDVLHEGSGNPGASNVNRMLGWRAGLVVLLVDGLKGALAALVGLGLAGRPGAWALGAAAVVGHIFPIGRRGGKGVATCAGFLLVLYPWFVLAFGVVFFVVARLLRKASIGSLIACIGFPVLVAVTRPGWEALATTAMAALVLSRHRANIQRLLRGTELSTGSPEG